MHHRHMFLFGTKEVKKTQYLLGLEPVRQGSLFLSIDCSLASRQVWMWPVEGQPMEEHHWTESSSFFLPVGNFPLERGSSGPAAHNHVIIGFCKVECGFCYPHPSGCDLYTCETNGSLTCDYPWHLWVIAQAPRWSTGSCSQNWGCGHCLCACPPYQSAFYK